MNTARFAAITLTLFITSHATLTAQDPFGVEIVADPFGAEDAPGTVIAEDVESSGESENADKEAQEDPRKKQRLEAINGITFDRRPSAILKLWSERGKKPAEPLDPIPPAEVAKEEAPKPEATSAEATSDPNAAAKEQTPEEKAAAEAKAKEEAKAKAAAEAKDKKQFSALLTRLSESVTLGEWDTFAKLVTDRKIFSEPESTALYNRLLDQLASQMGIDFSQVEGLSKEMRDFMQSMMGDQRNNPGQAYVEKHSLNFADLIAMIRSAPSELTDDEVGKLARLLRRTLGVGNQLNDFVATLKSEGDKLLPKQKAAFAFELGIARSVHRRFFAVARRGHSSQESAGT